LTLVLAVLTPIVPYLPFTSVFGFVPVPWTLTATVLGITALYVVAAEVTKRWFYRSTDLRALRLGAAH
jgi:Mg2+-importing ATPase